MTAKSKIRVLVVDDEEGAREGLRKILKLDGYDVAVAEDGVAALERAAERPPDVVVTDLKMPRMDGLALYDAVRRLPMVTPRFVFMSATAKPDLEGETRYVTKPIAIDRLTSLIDEAATHR